MALPGTFDRTAVVAGWFDRTAQPVGWGCEDALQNAATEPPVEPPVEEPKRQTPAGGNKRRRKRYEIDGRVYWAQESELPSLIEALLKRPDLAPEPAKESTPKLVKRPVARQRQEQATTVATPQPSGSEARFMAMLREFEARQSAELLSALAIARDRIIEIDDEEALLLLL